MKRIKRTRKRGLLIPKVLGTLFLSSADPNGSYTGTAVDGGKVVQDADDL